MKTPTYSEFKPCIPESKNNTPQERKIEREDPHPSPHKSSSRLARGNKTRWEELE
jgi:hypothetical protein